MILFESLTENKRVYGLFLLKQDKITENLSAHQRIFFRKYLCSAKIPLQWMFQKCHLKTNVFNLVET